MAISNTSILIKRSLSTGRPSSLQAGEFAYSYASNTLFIGTPDGNGVVNVGGQYYTSILDSATNANTASTLVKRDAGGSFYGRLYGNSNTASALINAQNFSISGGDITASTQSFDGSSAVVLNASLNNVPGLTAGYYGGSTTSSSTIPVVQVAANGRIMSIANTTVTSSFDISDGSTSSQVQSGNTFFHLGTEGIVTSVSQNTVTFSTDDTILRSNTSSVGPQNINTQLTISNDVNITGNLNVLGNTTTISVNEYVVDDPMIYLAGNNYTSDIVNIGFAANYYGDGDSRHTGLYRAHDNKIYYLFDNYIPELSGNNDIDRANSTFHVATLVANVTSSNIQSSEIYSSTFRNGTISGLTSAIAVSDGGTGLTSFTNGQVVVGSGTGALQQLANVSAINTTIASNDTINNLTTDVYGRVTHYNTQAIGGLTVSQGGTGQSTFTNGQLVVGSGTGALQQIANTGTAGSYGSADIVPVITTDAYGRVSSVSNTSIAISALAVTSGTLPIVRGGTNNTSFTNNTLTYFNGTGIVSLANVTFTATGTAASNNTITSLTVDNFGRASAVTYSQISGLTVPQGGTGFASATTNGIVYGNGTGTLGVTSLAGSGSDQTWSNQILTVTNAGVPTWASAMDGGTF
jgi:hypothetical protein